jgi:hypothetical protein
VVNADPLRDYHCGIQPLAQMRGPQIKPDIFRRHQDESGHYRPNPENLRPEIEQTPGLPQIQDQPPGRKIHDIGGRHGCG